MSKLFVISIDGFQTQDIPFMKTLPCFSQILQKAAVVKDIREVYPTLTYTIHTSIITGVTPDKHGVYHNTTPFLPDETTDWNVVGYQWKMFSDEIKAKTLIDAANEKGLVTASVMWPALGGQKPVHNLAEIWPNMCGTLYDTYKKSCSESVMELYFDRYIADFDWAHSIDTDSYSVDIAADMIQRFQPDLLLQHMISLDYKRHYTGNLNDQVYKALERMDLFLEKIIGATKEAGIYEETNFVILGDHGQMDVEKILNLNVIFVRDGWIELGKSGAAKDYRAYSFSNGYSTLIVLKEGENAKESERVYAYLCGLKEQYPEYIEHIYTKEEALRQEHLSGDFEFVVEAKQGCVITNALTGKDVTTIEDPEVKTYRSNHGYHPSKGPKPPFIAFGPDITPGIEINGGSLLDECPTLAKLLGVELPDMMGNPFPIIK